MKNVTINRDKLLAVVKQNRETHQAEFKEATANYRGKVLEALDARRLEIANGEKINLHFLLPEPQDHTS